MRLPTLGIASAFLLLLGLGAPPAVAQGSLTVTYTTQSHGGPYAPRNIVAVWFETAGGGFVKRIVRWAATRRQPLVAWTQQAGAADADAVSGATRASRGTLTATWNLQDRQGQVIPDGTYTIRVELADSNANLATQNAQGTFTFTKNATGSDRDQGNPEGNGDPGSREHPGCVRKRLPPESPRPSITPSC